ncbi:hypothetical protein BJY52DRAFT_1372798 [Lactarius psammicola]|nr:hypothetical protein BJY52DRAFT_1372798 [Lactarius psammicola]
MSNESSFPYSPRRQNDHLHSTEVHPPTGTLGNLSWPNGHQPGVNYAGPYHGRNEANYGDWAQYHNNVWNDGPPPPPAGQYAYQGSTNVGYAPPENAQHHLAAPGPPPVEYHIPPAHGIPNGSHAPPTAMPDVADPHSQNVPNTDPSGTSAMEDLKRLVNRYLHNPDSRVDTLRMELSPSGGRFLINGQRTLLPVFQGGARSKSSRPLKNPHIASSASSRRAVSTSNYHLVDGSTCQTPVYSISASSLARGAR